MQSEAQTIRALATPRTSLSPGTACNEVDRRFRRAPELRSVLVDVPASGPCLVNRTTFYEHMAGRLGSGWVVHAAAPVGELAEMVAVLGQHPVGADEAIADVAVELLRAEQHHGADDLLVDFGDGSHGTVGVVDVLSWLGTSYTVQAREVRHSERRLRALVQSGSDAIVVTDRDFRITFASPAYTAITGIDGDACVGSSVFLAVHPVDEAELRTSFVSAIVGEERAAGRFRIRSRERGWRWCEYQARSMFGDAAVQGLVLNFSDVDDRLKLEDDLRRQAWTDPLTGLPNRALFVDRLDRAVERTAVGRSRGVGLVYFDLDGFKMVNDSLGHHAGDGLLLQVGERLRQVARRDDIVARLGGDEFALLIEDGDEADPVTVARRLGDTLSRPFELDQRPVPIRASFGVVTHAGRSAVSGEELLRRADVAMYEAKRSGRDAIRVWSPIADSTASTQLSLVADLADAIEADALSVEYQPYVSLASGAVRGVEALVRWQHPVRGRIMPDEFIPAAETAGLIDELDTAVMRAASRQAREWFASGLLPADATLSVNVSGIELRAPDYAARVAGMLDDVGLVPSQLQLEITETSLIDDIGLAIGSLAELRGVGVKVAIDDFGIGYGSMSYLRDLPADTIKIDRSFVCGLDAGQRDVLIVNGILRLAEALGLDVIAEGAETPEQVRVLRELGCPTAQGYHFARPMAAADFAAQRTAGPLGVG